MNLEQTKLLALTMKLEQRTKEYKILCDLLDKLKDKNVEPDDERLLELKKLFEENQNEIVKLKKKIEAIRQ